MIRVGTDQEILVIKLTGKVFDNEDILSRHIELLRELLSDARRIIVVTGGGGIARRYIELARRIGVESNYWLDLIGIDASRLNSLLVVSALSEYAYPRVPVSVEEVLVALGQSRLVSLGGIIPGQSTASALLQVAEAIKARRVYYFSAVGRVYDKDPARYADARYLPVVKATELKAILEQKILPGEYALIDEKALDIAIRSGIEIQILDYRYPEQIHEALRGNNPGSIIIPS